MNRLRSLAPLALVALAGCTQPANSRVATRLNDDAHLQGDLPANPMQGKVLTSWIDPTHKTMSTLFANDTAAQHARTTADAHYPNGSVLSAVTWSQQEDPRWFGGNIPSKPVAVEVVTIGDTPTYQRYEGSPLKKIDTPQDTATARITYLLAQRASVMP